MVRAHERFSARHTLSLEEVSRQAHAVGDLNPLHHDAHFAATTRFGRPIASGTHTTALLLALSAAHFSKTCAMVGLEYWIRFRRPIHADESITLEWLVIRVRPSSSGRIVELRGRILGQDGRTSLGAKGKLLLLDAP